MMQWMCDICGYVHDEEDPPDVCPVCGAPGSKFSEYVEDDEYQFDDDSSEDDDDDSYDDYDN